MKKFDKIAFLQGVSEPYIPLTKEEYLKEKERLEKELGSATLMDILNGMSIISQRRMKIKPYHDSSGLCIQNPKEEKSMCSYLNEIQSEVNTFVGENKMFTAWDVTCVLRQKLNQPVHHYEVKADVHKMFNRGEMLGYTRTLGNLPNLMEQPWIYHPHAADPTAYQGNPVAAAPLALTNQTTAIPQIGSPQPAPNDGFCRFDSTNRLCVPNALIRQLGAKTGDQVFVYAKNDTLTVSKNNRDSELDLHRVADYLVDDSDNVRITVGAANKGGLAVQAGDCFEIEGDANSVTVKKHVDNAGSTTIPLPPAVDPQDAVLSGTDN